MIQPRILVVDDNSMVRKGIVQSLNTLQAEITEAEDGQQALDLLTSGQEYDLVITDIEMPRFDGIALCDHIKNSPATWSIPVIIHSMFDSEIEIEKGFNAGADAYVSKKDFKVRLAEVASQFLQKSKLRKESTILVTEDSNAVRMAISSFLKEQGYHVYEAENGREALALMANQNIDLVLSDLEMPVMDGLNLCRALKANKDWQHIPIIMMSIHDEASRLRRLIQNGAAAFLAKPFNFNELGILIDRILSDQFQIILQEKERLDNEHQLLLASISSLGNALEARDAYTLGHSESVAKLVVSMLRHASADEEEIARAAIGARLHDIGKIGIKDEVLLKPGKINPEEKAIIRTHPRIGAEILRPIPSLTDVIEVVLHHHERYDGAGYPDGLKGEEIPYWARLTAVADTFSALTGNRPYRKGIAAKHALIVLEEVKGKQLCPECVGLFLDWYRSEVTR